MGMANRPTDREYFERHGFGEGADWGAAPRDLLAASQDLIAFLDADSRPGHPNVVTRMSREVAAIRRALSPSAFDRDFDRWMQDPEFREAYTRHRSAIASEGAAPRAEGLDVERLARALHVNVGDRSDYDECPQTLDGWHRKTADILAAEYARLSRPSDERVPEEER